MRIARYIGRELCNLEAANHLADRLIRSADALCNFSYAPGLHSPLPFTARVSKVARTELSDILLGGGEEKSCNHSGRLW